MLLRIRLRLPDRPGSLGTVARTLGSVGADIAQIVVLERSGGRAVDDITVFWPQAASLDVLCDALAATRGVEIGGIWRTAEVPGLLSDVEVIGQLAADPVNGAVVLVEAVPKIFGGDWAAMIGPDGQAVHVSWRAPDPLTPPPVPESGARAFTGDDGVRYAFVPVGRSGRTLLLARVAAPPFHQTEIERLVQLVIAAEAVLGTDSLA